MEQRSKERKKAPQLTAFSIDDEGHDGADADADADADSDGDGHGMER